MVTIALAFAFAQPVSVAVNLHVLGYRDKTGWHQVDMAFAEKNRSLNYVCVNLEKRVKSISKVHLEGSDDEPPNGWFISSESARNYVSVSGVTPRFPRKIKTFTANAAYQSIVQKYLDSAGVKSKARVVKAYIVDLDGDGTNEVILNARNRENVRDASVAAKGGDYSLLLLRAIRDGKVVQTELQFTQSKDYSVEQAELNTVTDLDGDGKMELVTSGTGYEWSTGRIWSYAKGNAKMLIEATEGV